METKIFIVVERAELDRYIAEKMLRFHGVKHVMTFRSLSAALEFLGEETEVNGVALIGLQMMNDDKWSFMDAIRKLGDRNKHLGVYLLSTTARPNDAEKATSYPNFRGFIEKPITIDKIRDQVITLLKERDSSLN